MVNDHKALERVEAIAAALRCCGSSPKVDRCKAECIFYRGGYMGKCIPAMTEAAAALIEQLTAEPPSAPLTLTELRGMDGEPVWCKDNTVGAGIIRLAEDWATGQLEAHFWTFDTEGNPRCYNVRLTLEMGANFYRRKPDGGGE